jgi:hypothetical protein
MVSGPDLGGGFLYQLSYEGEEEGGPSFTIHAQDGGEDASGPPLGPPDFLGYRWPDSACMFGGPRCWERRFFLRETELARVRNAYGRTRFSMAAMLAHQYDGRPVPFREGLEEFLTRSDGPLTQAGLGYRVLGRAAAWIRDGGDAPRSLSVELEAGGAELVARQLEPFLIEPVGSRGPEEGLGGRAFLGTFQAGLRVDFGERPPGAGPATSPILRRPFAGFLVPVPDTGAPSPDNRATARETAG